jgi:hypothetical protein
LSLIAAQEASASTCRGRRGEADVILASNAPELELFFHPERRVQSIRPA